jgi:hypothetical protein
MKTLTYFEEFLPPSLLDEAILLSHNAQYDWTNPAKRSLSSRVNDSHFLTDYLSFLEKTFKFTILSNNTSFYKRNNDKFNPHIDNCKLNFLVYLTGETVDINNGTFFMDKDSNKIAIQVSNQLNSAILFDGEFIHGSVQALYGDSTWRYSLNTFIYDYTPGTCN